MKHGTGDPKMAAEGTAAIATAATTSIEVAK